MESKNQIEFVAHGDEVGLRLDRSLALKSEIKTRSRAQKLIERNHVLINGKAQKASYIVQEGDVIQVHIPIESNELIPLSADLEILHEDDDLAVIFKPSGLVVHPAEGHAQDTLVNILLDKIKNLSMGFNEQRPGIVHRLDKETSGLLVIAKNDETHTALSEQFRSRTVKREYYALVYGCPKAPIKRIESLIGRDQKHRKKFSSQVKTGKVAITNYQVFRELKQNITELRVRLETGRTHQIRVHLSELGHPIVGDILYGSNSKLKQIKSVSLKKEIEHLPRIALHAAVLGFTHPRTGQHLDFQSDWPSDMHGILELLA